MSVCQQDNVTQGKKRIHIRAEHVNIRPIENHFRSIADCSSAIIQLYPRGIKVTIQDRLNNKEVIIRPIAPYKMYCSLGTEQGTSKNQKAQHGKLVKTSATHNRKLACSAICNVP